MSQIITGIQQVGIGVSNAGKAWQWYRKKFGMDVPVFDDEAEAVLMKSYTGNDVHSRRAILALNMQGGGGFEVWQFKSRTPAPCKFDPVIGDLGINAVCMKTSDVEKSYSEFAAAKTEGLSELHKDPTGKPVFWIRDPYNNLFKVMEGNSWFNTPSGNTGGVCGVVIGVSDIEKSLPLYRDALGLQTIIYDEMGRFDDLDSSRTYRRIQLEKDQKDEGAFSRLLGGIKVELVQVLDREPRTVFKNRYWGDLGFIHVCFDVNDMETLKTNCEKAGYKFTIDSADSFDMGEAAGRFSYIEDPDGTLIEFVQTHKLPIMKKWGWYINLHKRKKNKPLPNWMLNSMALNRVKD
ncbi:MAG: VOC family protein [Balneolaceae bacterium]